MELRRHLGAAAEDAANARLLQRDLLGQRLEQLGRDEQAADVVVRLEQRQRLIDHVALVRLHLIHLARLQQLDDPARIEVDAERDAAAMLRQVLDRQPQPARTGGADHQPVAALGKVLVGQRVAEHLVVDPEVVDVDARLRHAGRSAGLEREDGPSVVALRHPPADRARRAAIRPGRTRTDRDRRRSGSPGGDPSRAGSRSRARMACRSRGRSATARSRGRARPGRRELTGFIRTRLLD